MLDSSDRTKTGRGTPNLTCPFCEKRITITATGHIRLHSDEYGRHTCGASGLSPSGANDYLRTVTLVALHKNQIQDSRRRD